MKSLTTFALVAALSIGAAFAQGASVAFGGLKHDASQPVEITADELSVDQATGSAVFAGNVVAGQGEMRLSAARVQVQYATGDVILTQGVNALSGQKLTADLNTGSGRMEGRVKTIFQTGGN